MGWAMVEEVGEDFQSLRLRCQDQGGRQHSLMLRLPGDYPSSPPDCLADLPFPFEPVWNPAMGLEGIVRQFRETLKKYQGVWEVREGSSSWWDEGHARIGIWKDKAWAVEVEGGLVSSSILTSVGDGGGAALLG